MKTYRIFLSEEKNGREIRYHVDQQARCYLVEGGHLNGYHAGLVWSYAPGVWSRVELRETEGKT